MSQQYWQCDVCYCSRGDPRVLKKGLSPSTRSEIYSSLPGTRSASSRCAAGTILLSTIYCCTTLSEARFKRALFVDLFSDDDDSRASLFRVWTYVRSRCSVDPSSLHDLTSVHRGAPTESVVVCHDPGCHGNEGHLSSPEEPRKMFAGSDHRYHHQQLLLFQPNLVGLFDGRPRRRW